MVQLTQKYKTFQNALTSRYENGHGDPSDKQVKQIMQQLKLGLKN